MAAKDVLEAKPVLNLKAIRGEPGTGFEKAGRLGEFECGNCRYFRDGGCSQKDMKKNSKQPRLPDGRVKVDAEDCCEFVARVGKVDKDE